MIKCYFINPGKTLLLDSAKMVEGTLPEDDLWEAMQKHCWGDIECLLFLNLNDTKAGLAIYGNNEALLRHMLPTLRVQIQAGSYALAGPLVITKHMTKRNGQLKFESLNDLDRKLIASFFKPRGGPGPNDSNVYMELFP